MDRPNPWLISHLIVNKNLFSSGMAHLHNARDQKEENISILVVVVFFSSISMNVLKVKE